jgi:uncharacterized RDD family membrane protein YckC
VYCPKCRAEYRDGFTECSDCRVPLIAERPPATPRPGPTESLGAVAPSQRPSNKSRNVSALVDLVVWTAVLALVAWITTELAYAFLGRPVHTEGRDNRDEISVASFGFAALCANLYLALSNGAGRSVGKAFCGLRLVVFVGPYPARPGFARGLVRSALQSGPWMGAIMWLTDFHDAFAGTTIVEASKVGLPASNPPQIAGWKIAAAVLIHLFFAMVYVVVGAI